MSIIRRKREKKIDIERYIHRERERERERKREREKMLWKLRYFVRGPFTTHQAFPSVSITP